MAEKQRAGIFEDEDPTITPAISDFDVSGFAVKKAVKSEPLTEVVRAVSERANFPSREPTSRPLKKADRRHRTGRNRQLNTRVDVETETLLYAIYDAHKGKENWTLGQIIGFGLHAFQRELEKKDFG